MPPVSHVTPLQSILILNGQNFFAVGLTNSASSLISIAWEKWGPTGGAEGAAISVWEVNIFSMSYSSVWFLRAVSGRDKSKEWPVKVENQLN